MLDYVCATYSVLGTPANILLYIVFSYIESTLYVLQIMIPLLLCRKQGEELQEMTYGMRNRQRDVYASLEVWMPWLGCLSTTIVHGACVQSTRGYTRGINLTLGESSSSNSSLKPPILLIVEYLKSLGTCRQRLLSYLE